MLTQHRTVLDINDPARDKISAKPQTFVCAIAIGHPDVAADPLQKRQPRNFAKAAFIGEF